jgi:tetraacyldisaccharide 4'-kinase
MYDSGMLASRRVPVPVVSVGGLTAGGSGKTPVAADLAARLCAAGVSTAILTHGFDDEMEVHRVLAPEARVYGGRNRRRLAERAAEEGARIVLLDSGFQHRRLHRDLDILILDDISTAGSLECLPAGPYREGLAALTRADLVVLLRRSSSAARGRGGVDPGRSPGSLLRELLEAPGAPPTVSVRLDPGPLVPCNESARGIVRPEPGVSLAGVMWPEPFFAEVRRVTDVVQETFSLPDHARIDAALGRRLEAVARDSGIVCTLKDSAKLLRVLGDSVPIWYLSENVVWEEQGVPPVAVRASLALLDPPSLDFSEGPAA